ncbi:MAG: glycosyltransferase family 4 protein, partial [Hyphomicrobiaceae bacterium]
MPTVLQVVPELDTGGAELSAIEIGSAVVSSGGRSLIATEGGRLETQAIQHGSEIIHLPVATKNPLTIVRNAQRLIAIARAQEINLIHARSRAPAWSALMASRHLKLPFVTTYHGAYSENGPIKRLYNSVMARADRVIANSNYTAHLIQQRYGASPGMIRIIHRGIDSSFSREAVSPDRIASTRARWNVAAANRIILQAARLTRWKGQSILIEAIDQLRHDGLLDGVTVVLAGADQGRASYRTELESMIAARKLDPHVLIVGHEHDMPAAFAAAHVAVIASIEPEAFGRTAAEAQGVGCPVIATRIGAPPETILAEPEYSHQDRTGWLVPEANAGALASSLESVLALQPQQRKA